MKRILAALAVACLLCPATALAADKTGAMGTDVVRTFLILTPEPAQCLSGNAPSQSSC